MNPSCKKDSQTESHMINETLPLYHFPQLREGDCFYDILARFHAHSGHLSSRASSLELFGSTPNLVPSVTLPYRADLICRWLGTESKITPKLIRDSHSAWQYLQLGSRFSEDDLRPIMRACAKPGRRKQGSMIRLLQQGVMFLRYCPVCIITDRMQVNEAYWHQAHQLYGVKYCPFHGIPLRNSPVRISSKLRRYMPAETVFKDANSEYLLTQAAEFNQESDQFYAAFLELSKTISWLLSHGLELKTGTPLRMRYSLALGLSPDETLRGNRLRTLLLQTGGEEFLKQLYPGNAYEALLSLTDSGVDKFSPLEHALVITVLGCNSVLTDYKT